MNKTSLVSLFDLTGNMVRPCAEKGFTTYCFDIQNEERVELFDTGGSITFLQADLLDESWYAEILSIFPKLVFGFPPCTDLAVSGAGHFANKLKKNSKYREEAMSLVYLVRDIAEALECSYMIENPVSVISSQWRKPDYVFNPFEYGGYLPKNDVHPMYPEYLVPRDAYAKKTCLWTDSTFIMPIKLPIIKAPKLVSQYDRLGGKSLKTKNIRSATPRGFAEAVSLVLQEQYA